MNNRNKNLIQQKRDQAVYSLIAVLCKVYRKVQQCWVTWMSRKFNNLTVATQKKVFFIGLIFSIFFLGLSCIRPYTIGWSLTQTSVRKMPLKPSPISLQDSSISMSVMAFQRHVDSLSKSTKGLMELDSLMKLRPGLKDSVELVKQMYDIK